MKVAIDLDGVAFKHPEFVKELWNSLIKNGNTVGVLTAHFKDLMYVDLFKMKELGLPRPNFYIHREEGENLIGKFKADAVKDFEIDVLIDDLGGDNSEIKKTFIEEGGLDSCVLLQLFPGEDAGDVARLQ